MFTEFILWCNGILTDAGSLFSFLMTEYDFGLFKFSPLGLLTLGGLTAYLAVAVIKWITI